MKHSESKDQDLRRKLDEADALLQRCLNGFSAFINGRKLARPEREKLRAAIEAFLWRTASHAATESTSNPLAEYSRLSQEISDWPK